MIENIFSPYWYRVAELKPRLRSNTEFHRHQYRGQPWFVLHDPVSERSHRFNSHAYMVLGLMNGERSVQKIWDALNNQLGDNAPNQGEIIQLLGRLHGADLLQCDVTPDTVELFRRCRHQQRADWKRRLWTPLAVRFPLCDPERWLGRFMPLLRPLFGRVSLAIWFATVFVAVLLAASNWSELSAGFSGSLLAPGNLMVLWFVYPLVKLLHELGHAFAVKVWGGEVHEMGIMFLVLMPIPYVDASAASAFRDKRKRMIVGAAGMMVEVFLASLASFVWLNVEPGMVRTIAFDVMIIGGVSTLLFNGNPLLRFDAYYILSDWLEIPNLADRSNRQLACLIQNRLFGIRNVIAPAETPGEAAWLVGYSISSFCYRMMILFLIIMFVAGKYFMVGVLLAIWATITQAFVPLVKKVDFLLTDPEIEPKRVRALTTSGALAGLLAGMVFLVPVPVSTRVEGVVWLPEHSQVRAGADCFVSQFLAQPDSIVQTGDPLIQCTDPMLAARIRIIESRLRELQARHTAERVVDRVQAAILEDEISSVVANLNREKNRRDLLTIRSGANGVFVVPVAQDLPARFARQGELLAYVVDKHSVLARVVVLQEDIGLVRQQTRGVKVKITDNVVATIPATIQREVPAASKRLPSKALGTAGGGIVPVEPDDSEGLTATQKVFQYELGLPVAAGITHPGKRLYARFDHGFQPMGEQWYRRLRQLFLRNFNV